MIFSLTLSDWLGLCLTPFVLIGLMVGLSAARKRGKIHPELSRKLVHICMGTTTLPFPWIFSGPMPVLLLCVGSTVLLIAIRYLPWLNSRFGMVMGAVGRSSMGDLYFPVAVATMFVASKGDPILFCVPLLILTFGDATAALIGVRYGQSRYEGTDGQKSFEGSAAFFAVAFLCVHVPLLLLTNTGRAESLLIALTLAIVAMLLEAVAWGGLDNLFIPLGAFALLHTFRDLSAKALLIRLGALLLLTIGTLLWRRRTTLRDSAVLCAALAGYVFWAIGGVRWLLPPLLVFVAYPYLSPKSEPSRHRTHSVASVVSVVSVGFAWIFAAGVTHNATLIYPYTISFGVQLALIALVRHGHHGETGPQWWMRPAITTVLSWLIVFAPYMVMSDWVSPAAVGISAVITVITAVIFWIVEPILRGQPTDIRLLMRQAGFAGLASGVGLIALGRIGGSW